MLNRVPTRANKSPASRRCLSASLRPNTTKTYRLPECETIVRKKQTKVGRTKFFERLSRKNGNPSAESVRVGLGNHVRDRCGERLGEGHEFHAHSVSRLGRMTERCYVADAGRDARRFAAERHLKPLRPPD